MHMCACTVWQDLGCRYSGRLDFGPKLSNPALELIQGRLISDITSVYCRSAHLEPRRFGSDVHTPVPESPRATWHSPAPNASLFIARSESDAVVSPANIYP